MKVWADGVDISDRVVWDTTTTTAPGTFTINDPVIDGTSGISVSWGTTTGGEWWPAEPDDPDMTDWPSSDIFDYYGRELARKRPNDEPS